MKWRYLAVLSLCLWSISFAKPAQRVISLAPDLTEILFSIGAGDKIVGRVQGSDYPPKAKQIPIVATFNNADLEKIIQLYPDLVVVWSEGKLAQSLRKLHIAVYISHPMKITDVAREMRELGQLTGTEKSAYAAAKRFEERVIMLRNKFSHKKTKRVFYQVWQRPLITVTRQSWINDVIELCGGKNIFSELQGAAPEVSVEAVIKADPDVIISTKSHKNWRDYWRQWTRMKAVKNNALYDIEADWIERNGPRILQGAEVMCNAI